MAPVIGEVPLRRPLVQPIEEAVACPTRARRTKAFIIYTGAAGGSVSSRAGGRAVGRSARPTGGLTHGRDHGRGEWVNKKDFLTLPPPLPESPPCPSVRIALSITRLDLWTFLHSRAQHPSGELHSVAKRSRRLCLDQT